MHIDTGISKSLK